VTVHARWWRVPTADVPRTAVREAQVDWLYDWWERIDAWITEVSGDAMMGQTSTASEAGE